MDTSVGFNLLADSSDINMLAHPHSPHFCAPSTPPTHAHQQPQHDNQQQNSNQQQTPNNNNINNNNSNSDNLHPLLANDVQVVDNHEPQINQQHQQNEQQQLQYNQQQQQQYSQQKLDIQQQLDNQQQQLDNQQQQLDNQQQQLQHQHQHEIQRQQQQSQQPPHTLQLQQQHHDSDTEAGGGDDELGNVGDDEEEVRISEMHTPLEPAMKNVLVCLIGEYLNEVITLRMFLSKVRQCLCSSDGNTSNKEVFTWILRCLLEGGAGSAGHMQRMASFLEENGVTKQEIEISSSAIKQENGFGAGMIDFDIGEKRKRREKKSISRGLRSAPNKWCKAESQLLIRLVHENGDKSWKRIAEQLGGGKTGAQCAQHWKRVLSPQIRKGSWDDQEEELLLALVERYGQSWKNIAGEIKSRTDIQCRYQYQKSCLSRQCEWQPQEDTLLAKKVAQVLHESSGSNNLSRMQSNNLPVNWVEVAKFIARAKLTKIPRTALEAKQRWYALNGNALPNPHMNDAIVSNHTRINSPPTHTTSNFHNYTNINSNFTMVAQTF